MKLASSVADGDCVPGCHLEDDGGGVLIDLGVHASDDPREGLRAVGVGDDQIVFIELVLTRVERVDHFVFGRWTDGELTTRELVIVEHMARVTQFEGDVVGDVDDIVD